MPLASWNPKEPIVPLKQMIDRHKTPREPKNMYSPGFHWSRRNAIGFDGTIWRFIAILPDGKLLQKDLAITDFDIAGSDRRKTAAIGLKLTKRDFIRYINTIL